MNKKNLNTSYVKVQPNCIELGMDTKTDLNTSYVKVQQEAGSLGLLTVEFKYILC